jgi:hypothetical protein
MSLDFYVFSSPQHQLTRDQLAAAMSESGFEIDVYEEIRSPKLIEGEVSGYCTVLAWDKKTITRAALHKVLSTGEREVVDELFETNVLAYCNINVTSAQEFLENFDTDYFERPDDPASQDAIAAARAAQIVYEISTSSGRSEFSYSLQKSMCKVVAKLTKGIIEDPQEGNLFWPTEANDYFGHPV